jgi:hypothetical protein
MPENLTPERLAGRICRRLNLSLPTNAEVLSAMLREALVGRFETAVAATKAACLSIAEEEAERCRRHGAYPAQAHLVLETLPCFRLILHWTTLGFASPTSRRYNGRSES